MSIKQVVEEFQKLVLQEKVEQAEELIEMEKKGREDELADSLYETGKKAFKKDNYSVAICLLEVAEKIQKSENKKKAIRGVLSVTHNNYADSFENDGNFEKAEYHYTETLRINPGYADAHYNYANLLRNMKNFEKAECHYKKALEINSKLAEAHRDLGILYRDQKRYRKALDSFEDASNIFKKKKKKKPLEQREAEALKYFTRAILLWRDESWGRIRESIEKAINNFIACGMNDDVIFCKNILLLVTVDESFNESLTSESLIDLRKKISEVYEAVTTFKEDLLENKIHEYEVLAAKLTCIETLYKALNFIKYDNRSLDVARETLREEGFTKAVHSINCLDNFVIDLSEYNDLETIPEPQEKKLLENLKPMRSFDGYITEGILHEMQKPQTPIQSIEYNLPTKKWVRVGIVQLHFTLITRNARPDFPPTPEDKYLLKKKFLKYLDLAVKEKLDIVCFPELSMTPEILEKIKRRKIDDLIIIGGTYYENRKNICPIIYNNTVKYIQKIHPSKYCEFSPMNGKGMIPGDRLYFFVTPAGKFVVFICEDFRHEMTNVLSQTKDVDFLFVVSYNPKPERFHEMAHWIPSNYPIYVLQCNVAEINEKFGKSCVFGIIDKNSGEELKKEGFRSGKYESEVSEINGEGMLIAEFNIVTKSIPVPTLVEYSTIRNIKLVNG